VQDSAGARVASATSASTPVSQGASSRGGELPGALPAPAFSADPFPAPYTLSPNQRYDYNAPGTSPNQGVLDSVFANRDGIPWTPILIGLGIIGASVAYSSSTRRRRAA